GWDVKIALGIWRAHCDLAFAVHITLRDSDRAGGFEDQIIFFFHFVWHQPVSDSARNHDVIFGPITLFPENTLQCSAAFKNEDDLIGAAVLVVLVFALGFLRQAAV